MSQQSITLRQEMLRCLAASAPSPVKRLINSKKPKRIPVVLSMREVKQLMDVVDRRVYLPVAMPMKRS